jgi:hypothetical protein
MRRAVVVAAAGAAMVGCGGTSAAERIEAQLDGRAVPGLGRLSAAKCSRNPGGWDCQASARGRSAYCAVDAAKGRIAAFFCTAEKPPTGASTDHSATDPFPWDFARRREGRTELYYVAGGNERVIYARARPGRGHTVVTLYIRHVDLVLDSAVFTCVELHLPGLLRGRRLVDGTPHRPEPAGVVSLHPELVEFSHRIARRHARCRPVPLL